MWVAGPAEVHELAARLPDAVAAAEKQVVVDKMRVYRLVSHVLDHMVKLDEELWVQVA